MQAVFATQNPGKLREAAAILEGSGLELVVPPMWIGQEETGLTYLENARAKAAAVARLTQRPVLAEDAGLEVDALAGLPGPRSARFAGPAATDEQNNAKLLQLLRDVADERRTARYRAVAILRLPSSAEVWAEGVFEGRIVAEPRGGGGFGYDPLFVPTGEHRTAAELTLEEKNAVSHRASALRGLVERLREAGAL